MEEFRVATEARFVGMGIGDKRPSFRPRSMDTRTCLRRADDLVPSQSVWALRKLVRKARIVLREQKEKLKSSLKRVETGAELKINWGPAAAEARRVLRYAEPKPKLYGWSGGSVGDRTGKMGGSRDFDLATKETVGSDKEKLSMS